MFPIIHQSPVKPPVQIVAPCVKKSLNQVSFQGKLPLIESHQIFANFEEISAIPRASRKERQISRYLKGRLKSAGFKVRRKFNGTIIAHRALNKQKNNAVILQAHMDMVEVQASKSKTRVPIEMHVKDGWLYANKRTLGADNGIGIAQMLTIADDPKYQKYPLQFILTTDEETGLHGAKSLTSRDFYGKHLINLDSEENGKLVNGCAGMTRFHASKRVKMHSLHGNDYTKISVKLSGTRGGHSALITNESLNPIKLLVSKFREIKDLKLISLSGGEKDNAVPMNAMAEFIVPKDKAQAVIDSLKTHFESVKNKNLAKNPNFTYTVSSEAPPSGIKYIDPTAQGKIFDTLSSLPTGVLSKFEKTGVTKSSQNLGILKISDGLFHLEVSARSAIENERQQLIKNTSSTLSSIFGGKISTEADPIWNAKPNSILQDAAIKAYSETSGGQKAKVAMELGGLEPARFVEVRPDLDCISIGPTIEEPHSIQERVKIDTVISSFNWLEKILELLKKN